MGTKQNRHLPLLAAGLENPLNARHQEPLHKASRYGVVDAEQPLVQSFPLLGWQEIGAQIPEIDLHRIERGIRREGGDGVRRQALGEIPSRPCNT